MLFRTLATACLLNHGIAALEGKSEIERHNKVAQRGSVNKTSMYKVMLHYRSIYRNLYSLRSSGFGSLLRSFENCKINRGLDFVSHKDIFPFRDYISPDQFAMFTPALTFFSRSVWFFCHTLSLACSSRCFDPPHAHTYSRKR
uniref:Uncharacterized protein n=1 Tax=Pristionchus pacificus TaxID=54126 RepID=A0A2A6CDT7_PRIPA|eukprot:PDM76248.1 hypothetical protein PRIPAC_39852 [Pristionchus pacificus]